MRGRGLDIEGAQDDEECLALLLAAGVDTPAAVGFCREREGLTIDYASASSRGSSDAEEAPAERLSGDGFLLPSGSRSQRLVPRQAYLAKSLSAKSSG
jgi:hypothetical protein